MEFVESPHKSSVKGTWVYMKEAPEKVHPVGFIVPLGDCFHVKYSYDTDKTFPSFHEAKKYIIKAYKDCH